MPSTIDTFPHVGENVTGIGTIAWTNPGNILSGDDIFSTVTTGAGTTSNYLQGRDYQFTLNPGSTINGITVKTRLKCSGSSSALDFALTDNTGTIFGASKNQVIAGGGVLQNYTLGGVADLWSATITPTITNNTNFGVRVWHTGAHTIDIDWITIAVTYTPGITVMPADAGNYLYNQFLPDTNLLGDFVLSANTGNYPYNGLATTLLERAYVMPAGNKTYPYNTYQAGLARDIQSLAADSKTFPFTGYDVTFNSPLHVLGAFSYTYLYNTYVATLTVITPATTEISMVADPWTYKYTGWVSGLQQIPIRVWYDPYNTHVAPVITFHAPGPIDFDIAKTTINTVVGGSTTPLPDERDFHKEQVTGSDTYVEAQLNTSAPIVGYRSEHPEIAAVSNSGYVSWVSGVGASVKIVADSESCSKGVFVNVNKVTGGIQTRFVDYISGYLAYKLAHDFDAMLVGTNYAENAPGLSNWSPLRRNMNNWALRAGVDTSAIGITNSIYPPGHSNVTLITPKHAIGCNHNLLNVGAWQQWLAADGTDRVCQRTIIARYQLSYVGNGHLNDGEVYVLDSDVDDFIHPIKILPSNFTTKLPSIWVQGTNTQPSIGQCWLPFFSQNRDPAKYSFCHEWSGDAPFVVGNSGCGYGTTIRDPPSGSNRHLYLLPGGGISGDSGDPHCLIIDGELILHSMVSGLTWWSELGPLNAAIDLMGSNPNNYHAQTADLSAYP